MPPILIQIPFDPALEDALPKAPIIIPVDAPVIPIDANEGPAYTPAAPIPPQTSTLLNCGLDASILSCGNFLFFFVSRETKKYATTELK